VFLIKVGRRLSKQNSGSLGAKQPWKSKRFAKFQEIIKFTTFAPPWAKGEVRPPTDQPTTPMGWFGYPL
jgi:hypothetical protein